MSGIAPTLPIDGTDRPRAITELATLLDRAAAGVIAAYDTDLAAAQALVTLSGTVLGLVGAGSTDGSIYLFGADGSQSAVLASFGATNVAPENVEEFSVDRLGELAAADLLVVLTSDGYEGADPTTTRLWQELPAVKAGHVIVLTEDESQSFYNLNPLRLPAVVAAIERIAAAAPTPTG